MKETDSKPPTPPPPEDNQTFREAPEAEPTDPKKNLAHQGIEQDPIPKHRKYPKPLR
ncbi:MAG: hypothetical protein ACI8PQ_003349 [Planctomycetota bacterium]|jgi:hypothetical protein